MNIKKLVITIASLLQLSLADAGPSKGRVVNGVDVRPPFKYKFMTAIFYMEQLVCGGTLITPNHVMTAAHCFPEGDSGLLRYDLHLHRHDLSKSVYDEGGEAFKIDKLWVHEQFDMDNLYYDIAIVRLDSSAKYMPKIILDSNRAYNEEQIFIAAGWGATKTGGSASMILQEAILPVYNREYCVDKYKEIRYKVMDHQLCVGYRGGDKDTCQGDSGGPLFGLRNNIPVIVGITSNGISCAEPNTPGLYTSVSVFRDWIKNVLSYSD